MSPASVSGQLRSVDKLDERLVRGSNHHVKDVALMSFALAETAFCRKYQWTHSRHQPWGLHQTSCGRGHAMVSRSQTKEEAYACL